MKPVHPGDQPCCTGLASLAAETPTINGTESLCLPYRGSLNRWLVVRLLPKMQRITVAAFCKRADAEGYLQAVRRLVPQAQFVIRFLA